MLNMNTANGHPINFVVRILAISQYPIHVQELGKLRYQRALDSQLAGQEQAEARVLQQFREEKEQIDAAARKIRKEHEQAATAIWPHAVSVPEAEGL